VKKRAKRKPIREKVIRNPEQTRQRILSAALKEFARHGFAGARVDVIARSARINKRMLYHYFGNKEVLFRAVLRRKISERKAWFADAPQQVLEALPYWVELMASDPDWIRLLQFEALNWGEARSVIDEAPRRRAWKDGMEKLKKQQSAGLAPAELDAGHLMLSCLALAAYPFAFPQFARFATGLRVSSPEFQKRHAEFLRRLAARLKAR
jgi:AcrR family transcriptional regulator